MSGCARDLDVSTHDGNELITAFREQASSVKLLRQVPLPLSTFEFDRCGKVIDCQPRVGGGWQEMKAQLPLPKAGLGACALIVCLTVYFTWLLAFRQPDAPVGNKPSGPTTATNSGAVGVSEVATNFVPPPMVAPDSGVGVREVVGIGVELRRPNVENGVPQIQRVLPGSPAEQEGLTPGLNIHKVDGISLRGVSLSEITHLIRGPAGTKVRLELYEGVDGEKFTVELTRQKLELR